MEIEFSEQNFHRFGAKYLTSYGFFYSPLPIILLKKNGLCTHATIGQGLTFTRVHVPDITSVLLSVT